MDANKKLTIFIGVYTDTTRLVLTGLVPFILIASGTLAFPISFVLIRLYKHWRHVGSIQMIAGPDLATTTVEPHEFLEFLRGRLARRFIDGPQALNLRLAEMDLERDQDGRFRVNDFFCREETWRTTLSHLVNQSEVVLMDLQIFQVLCVAATASPPLANHHGIIG